MGTAKGVGNPTAPGMEPAMKDEQAACQGLSRAAARSVKDLKPTYALVLTLFPSL